MYLYIKEKKIQSQIPTKHSIKHTMPRFPEAYFSLGNVEINRRLKTLTKLKNILRALSILATMLVLFIKTGQIIQISKHRS